MKRFTSIQLGGSTIKYTSCLILSLLFSIFIIPANANSFCNLACNDYVQISLPANCEADITVDALLEGAVPTGTAFTIYFAQIDTGYAVSGTASITGIDDWGALLGNTEYTITADGCSNSCWGVAIIEQNVFPTYNGDVLCSYIPAQDESVDLTFDLNNVAAGVTLEITAPNPANCNGNTPAVSLGNEINFPCDSALSGWCSFSCSNTLTGTAVSGTNIIYTYQVTVDDIDLATEYLNNIDSEFICVANYKVPACIPCETWCGGNPPAFVTIEDLRQNLKAQAGDCVNNITNIREVVKTDGEVCDGIETVIETYGDFTQHGETETRLLLSQAYKQLPIPLFDPISGELKPNIIFPGKKKVDCGNSTDPVSIESVPTFYNEWREVITYPDTCLEVHYYAIVDTVREPVELVPGVWSIQDVIKKELRDSMRCAQDSSLSAQILVHPYEPLYPSKFCNLVSSYSDHETPLCGDGKKIIRDWTIVDWCAAKLVTESQVIEERDHDAPIGPDVSVTHTVGMKPWTCEADFDLTLPVFTDDCDSDLDISFDIINSNGVWVPEQALTPGTYSIEFTAKDDCNNFSKVHKDTLVVIDDVRPVAVCKDKLVVSITPDMDGGIAKIEAGEFDKGSHDGGCGSISKYLVLRFEDYIQSVDHAFGGMTFAGLPVTCDPATGTVSVVDKDKFGDALPPVTNELAIWNNSVKFCCTDIGSEQLVLMRVWDGANNYNDCTVKVEVQDKVGVIFSCPDDVTIKCTEYSENVKFGDADADFICGDSEVSFADDQSLNSCGAGRVIRIWSTTDPSGKVTSCPQIITVQNENVFDPLSIRWPIHYKGGLPGTGVRLEPKDDECVEIPASDINFGPVLSCVDEDPACTPEYKESDACGLVGISMDADTIFQADNTCMKVIKRWTVIDWCTWAPNGDPNAPQGDDENDTDADQFQLVEDWCLDSGCINENEGSAYYRYLPSEDGGFVDRDGYYTYDQVLLFHDDMDPEFMMMEVDTMQPGIEGSCLGNIALINTARDQGFCGSELLQWFVTLQDANGDQVGSIQTGLGNAFGFTVSEIPLGTYTILWNVKDGCGNGASQETEVVLLDSSKPTPICIQNISTAVMNTNGEVEIWAEDFDPDGKSFDPCDDEVFYSFSADSIVPGLTLTCADVLYGTEEMKMWVHDASGNSAACTINIRVDDNGICDDYVHTCDVTGGDLVVDGTGVTDAIVCVGGGDTRISINISGNEGNSGFIIIDGDGNIIGMPSGPNIDFNGRDEGLCYLHHISTDRSTTGVSVGNNLTDIEGCFEVSNAIKVTKVACNSCGVAGGNLVTDVTDLEEVTVCIAGGKTSFDAKVWENIGESSYVVTDSDGIIQSFPTGNTFDFAGSTEGVCYLYHISSDGSLTGYEIGNNINDVVGCYSLSNKLTVVKVACNDCGVVGGNLITDVTDLKEITVCISGENTGFDAKVWENLGESQYVITDEVGNITSFPDGPNFDFAGSGVGVCLLWHLSFDGTLTGAEVGANASDIEGCHDLSNPIIVTKVDSGEACEDGNGNALIAGNVSTPFGESIGEARVSLDNDELAEFPVSKMTSGLSGNYAFSSNPMYSDYSVSVKKDDDHLNGVSTLDLVFMQHHILGLKPFDSAYKTIAADVNNDQRVTASDLVQLRKLILGVTSELADNDSWRFVDKNQTFNNLYNPWPFTEQLDVNDLSSDMASQDFIGVKIGDVNGSARPSNLQATEVRSSSTVTFTINDATADNGDLIEMSLNSENFKAVSGLQFTISHPGLELIGVNSNSIEINGDNIANHGAFSSVSWNAIEQVEAEQDIITFVFIATEDMVTLSDVIEINDRITKAEVYTGNSYDINNIELEFESSIEGDVEFELLQNTPNPFSNYTEIGFKLPKAGEATLKLFDVSGRLLHSQTATFGQGTNKITISSDLIGSGGLIYYSLESGNFSATRKMVSLK